jgi:hypothetical protein
LAVYSFSLPAAFGQTPQLLLFDDDHKTFLGCLNCPQFDKGSICDQYGEYGSQFDGGSIWNPMGNFGSAFSDASPWNQFSTSGPVIVDKSGKSYGRFTANRSAPDRTQIDVLNRLTDSVSRGTDLDAARDSFCEH